MGGTEAQQQVPQWKHALAGCTAGLGTAMALHPLDVIKTRLQVQDGAGLLPAYRGTVDAARQILRQEGWRALYAGLTPALLGGGVAWGVYFFAYNRAKERYQRMRGGSGRERLPPSLHLASAAEAGVLVCFMTNPIWVVKTRLQLQRRTIQQAVASAVAAPAAGAGAAAATRSLGWLAPRPAVVEACALEYRGFAHAFVQIARCEGLGGLYRGLLPSLLLVSHGAIQFAVYEELKTLAQQGLGAFTSPLGSSTGSSSSSTLPTRRDLGSLEITACGALSKLAASTATYPSQVIRSRLQQRMNARSVRYSGVGDVLRKTLQREGVGGLYKGLVPNVMRVMPQSALTFLLYESVMRALRTEATPDV